MACEDYTQLKGVTHISKELESQNILHGTIDFFNWGFLNIGAYQNITINPMVSGVYGGQKYRLRPVKDNRFNDGQVWEGFRSNWVWETGVSFSPAPIRVSGVYVGGSFYNSADSIYGHYVDYKRGRVVFSGTIPTTSVVTAEFSPRTITFMDSESPEIKTILSEIDRVEKGEYLHFGSGSWNTTSDMRAELPVVSVNVNYSNSYRPYQIGGGQYCKSEINFFVVSDNKFYRDQICDTIGRQNEKVFWLPNRSTMKAASGYPLDLDYKGSLVNTPVEYPSIVAETGVGGYQWRQIRLYDTQKRFMDQPTSSLFTGIIKTQGDIILGEI
jgi:hypothetical protein